MPVRSIFRDPLTGRIISQGDAFDLESSTVTFFTDAGSVTLALEYGNLVEDQDTSGLPNIDLEDSKWGARMIVGGTAGSLQHVQGLDFPSGFDSFRVTFKVGEGGRYSKGYASSGWFSADQWPPDFGMIGVGGTQGVDNVVFRRD